MGMFTTVITEEGAKVQFNTGRGDCCESFKEGEKLPVRVFEGAGRGYLLDGIYSGTGQDREEFWVVIRDGVLETVLPADEPYDAVMQRFAEPSPDPALWPPEAWKKKRKEEALAAKESELIDRLLQDFSGRMKIGMLNAAFIISQSERPSLLGPPDGRALLEMYPHYPDRSAYSPPAPPREPYMVEYVARVVMNHKREILGEED